MLKGELGGPQFDQTRTYRTRQVIPGGVQKTVENLGGGGDMDLMATDTSA